MTDENHQDQVDQPNGERAPQPSQRRCFALCGLTSSIGAATTIVGVIGVEGPAADGSWRSCVEWVPLMGVVGEGWHDQVEGTERVLGAGRISLEVVQEWAATANGITREVEEIEDVVFDAPSLQREVEGLIDQVLACPAPEDLVLAYTESLQQSESPS